MNDVSIWLTENWKYVTGAVAILGYFGWDKAKVKILSMLEKLKSAKIKNVVTVTEKDGVDIEAADVAAIAHLRKRAIEVNDEDLLVEIKSVAAKFFDIHSNYSIKSNDIKSI